MSDATLPQDVPGPAACMKCGEPIVTTYWVMNGDAACTRCKESRERSGGRAGFVRLLKAVGLGLALGGIAAAIWAIVEHYSGSVYILLGLLLATAAGAGVRVGSGNRGGWFYQLVAVVVTYACIAIAIYPSIVAQLRVELEGAEGLVLHVIGAFVSLVSVFSGDWQAILLSAICLLVAWLINLKGRLEITGPFDRTALRATPRPPVDAPPLG